MTIYVSLEQHEALAASFQSAGNYLGYRRSAEAIKFLNESTGNTFLARIVGLTPLFYYHHRHDHHDVYTIFLVFYDYITDSFVEFTLYEHDARRQTTRPEYAHFKEKIYPRDEYLHKIGPGNKDRTDIPIHHRDRLPVTWITLIDQILNIFSEDVNTIVCEL